VSDELVHPSAEVLSDHRAGLLEPDLSGRIEVHVAHCAHCRSELDALDAAVDRLRDVGRDRAPMPPDVAHRLETALAAEVRQRAAVVPMRPADRDRAAVEHERTSADRHRRRSLILVAAGTVAVLAIGGVAADQLFTGGRTGSSNAGSDSAATGGGRPGPANSSQRSAKTNAATNSGGASDALAIDQANFASIAPIAISTGARAGRSSASCFDAAVPGYHARSWLSASIDWRGVHAWLLYDPTHSRGVVVDCAAGPRIMYQHQF
jgi:hypothetical protein